MVPNYWDRVGLMKHSRSHVSSGFPRWTLFQKNFVWWWIMFCQFKRWFFTWRKLQLVIKLMKHQAVKTSQSCCSELDQNQLSVHRTAVIKRRRFIVIFIFISSFSEHSWLHVGVEWDDVVHCVVKHKTTWDFTLITTNWDFIDSENYLINWQTSCVADSNRIKQLVVSLADV